MLLEAQHRIARACAALPKVAWVPLASGITLGVTGVLALLTHQLFLFPSLGPTAMMMTGHPHLPAAQPYNAVVGHLLGLAAGFFSVLVLGLADTPSIFAVRIATGPRVAAAVLAIALASGLELLLRAQHPPGAATTLLAALGSFRPTWHDAGAVFVGVVGVVATAHLLNRLRATPHPRARHAQHPHP
jgi:CBS-domain-containing membrane protein